jgi:hypothetical protein
VLVPSCCPAIFTLGLDMFKWFRRRREAARLEQSDLEALIRRYGDGAYHEACRPERDVGMSEKTDYHGSPPDHWGMVAPLLAGRIEDVEDEADKHARLDTAIRMLDF